MSDYDAFSDMSDVEKDDYVNITQLQKLLENKKLMYSLFPSNHLKLSIERLTRIINKINKDNTDNTDNETNDKTNTNIDSNTLIENDTIVKNNISNYIITNNNNETLSHISECNDSDSDNDVSNENVSDNDDSDNSDESDNEMTQPINIILSIKPSVFSNIVNNDNDVEESIEQETDDEDYIPSDDQLIGKKRTYNTRNSNTKHTEDFNSNKKLKIDKEDQELIDEIERKNKEKQKAIELRKNMKSYKSLINDDKNVNDTKYFEKLNTDKQKEIIQILKDIKQFETIDKPYRILLLQKDLPAKHKSIAMRKINTLVNSPPGFGEYNKIKKWVDGFMNIPFGVYNKIDMSLSNGIDKCTDFMLRAKSILDSTVYGLNDAKTQILQLIAQIITNPSSTGTAIAIKGPMGTGKTTLVKEGISKILGRPFAFIPLGGATDSSYLEGHSYTYEGSNWGKIVDILMNSGSMSPLIYFDELDKVSKTSKGDEIIGILTHLTDTTQNSCYHDKYFSEIEFDLSRALYIFSYNEEHLVNPILKDRMYCIETSGYNTKEKTVIATQYLIPSIMKNVGFNPFINRVNFNDSVIEYIITTYTQKEKGVRNLKRCLEIIFTKLNLYRIMKPGTVLFDEKQTVFEVNFPYTITRETCDLLLKKDVKRDMSYMMLYS